MTTQSMTGHTQSMTSRTESMSFQPNRAALAARSLEHVDKIVDTEERRRAFAHHMSTSRR